MGYGRITEWSPDQIEQAAEYVTSLVAHVEPQLKYLVLQEVGQHYKRNTEQYRYFARQLRAILPSIEGDTTFWLGKTRGLWICEVRLGDRYTADLFLTRKADWVFALKHNSAVPSKVLSLSTPRLVNTVMEASFDLRELVHLIKTGIAEALKAKAAEHYDRATKLSDRYDSFTKL